MKAGREERDGKEGGEVRHVLDHLIFATREEVVGLADELDARH